MTLVRLEGALDKLASNTARTELERSVGSKLVLVDLSDVTFLDSAGLHVLFGLARTIGKNGGRLGVVVPPASPLRRVVEVAHVAGVAVVCDSAAEGSWRLKGVSAAPLRGTSEHEQT